MAFGKNFFPNFSIIRQSWHGFCFLSLDRTFPMNDNHNGAEGAERKNLTQSSPSTQRNNNFFSLRSPRLRVKNIPVNI